MNTNLASALPSMILELVVIMRQNRNALNVVNGRYRRRFRQISCRTSANIQLSARELRVNRSRKFDKLSENLKNNAVTARQEKKGRQNEDEYSLLYK